MQTHSEKTVFFDERVNDYKLFPRDFDDFVKGSLGICIEDRKQREPEKLEYRPEYDFKVHSIRSC